MAQSLPSEASRFILRLSIEVRESKWEIIAVALAIRESYGSFTSFRAALIQRPAAPSIFRLSRALVRGLSLFGAQSVAMRLMWDLFGRQRANLPVPWKDVDTEYVVQLLPTWSALRVLHFLAVRFGAQPNSVRQVEPWHFRQSLVSAYIGSVLWIALKRGGIEDIFFEVNGKLQREYFLLLSCQIQAAFGRYDENLNPILDYRHKPRFAWAAVFQGCILLLPLCSGSGSRLPLQVILYTIPVSSMATFLLFATHGHDPDFMNTTMSDKRLDKEHKLIFCVSCRNTALNSLDELYVRKGSHHLTSAGLQRSAESGCRICSTLWEQRARVPKDFIKYLKYWEPATTYARYDDSINFGFKEDLKGVRNCRFQICKAKGTYYRWGFTYVGPDIQPQSYLKISAMSRHTGCDDNMYLVTKWLQNCLIHHGVCGKNRDNNFRPLRLLWVGDNKISVHLTQEMPSRVLYLTLSHCWGQVHLIRLVKDNQATLRTNISWDELPKTFQDAVTLTRRLGFHYLWIDSLCIIQDSEEDWDHEAKLMGKIYKNAVCNIAASDAPDSSHGCFYPRNSYTLHPALLPSGSDKEEYLINETDIFDNHVLYTRAWVLQEALLARRTIDCGRGQLFWRCGEMRASEVFPSGIPRHVVPENHPASMFETKSADGHALILDVNILEERLGGKSEKAQLPIAPGKGTINPESSDSTFGLWAAIVASYTSMSLTRDTDRTVALSGVIDIFRPFFGAHCAGLWNIFMPVELLWFSRGNTALPSIRQAPTWSWMSIEGAVTYERCEFEYGVDILVTQFVKITTQKHENQIHLSALLFRACWEVRDPAKPRKSAVISSIEGRSYQSYSLEYVSPQMYTALSALITGMKKCRRKISLACQ